MFGNKKIRCAVLHDHVLLRQGLRRLLEDEPDMEVVAEAGNVAESLQEVFELRPEVVIADAAMFGLAADQVERLIVHESPHSQVLFLSGHQDDAMFQGVRPDRASCAARKTSAQELTEMVRKIHFAKGAAREMPRRGRVGWTPEKRALTTRERQVLKLLAEGKTVRSAAAVLGLSLKTVDAHKFNLMRKLGIHNKAELVMWAIQKRVVKLPANL
jgi:two-component system, NarL family, response regulator NreC